MGDTPPQEMGLNEATAIAKILCSSDDLDEQRVGMVKFREQRGWNALGFTSYNEWAHESYPYSRQRAHSLYQQGKVTAVIKEPLSEKAAEELYRLSRRMQRCPGRLHAEILEWAHAKQLQPQMVRQYSAVLDKRNEMPLLQGDDSPVPPQLLDVFEMRRRLCILRAEVQEVADKLETEATGIFTAFFSGMWHKFRSITPHTECLDCDGEGCRACGDRGWLTEREGGA